MKRYLLVPVLLALGLASATGVRALGEASSVQTQTFTNVVTYTVPTVTETTTQTVTVTQTVTTTATTTTAPTTTTVPPAASVYLNNLGEFGRPAKDWNQASNWLPDGPRLVGILKNSTASAVVALSSYGVAEAYATIFDPLCTLTNTNGWGNAPTGTTFRCPALAKPATGTDGHIVFVQPDGSIVELWKAVRTGPTSWSCGAAGKLLAGGWNYPFAATRGSSFSLASGLFVPDDLTAQTHALLAVLPQAAVRKAYMAPSNDTDGIQFDGIPEGARLVLDPAASLAGLSPLETAIAKILKTYGALVGDKTGGSDLSFVAVAPETWTALGQPNLWAAAGYSGYPSLSGLLPLIPKLRIEAAPITVKP